VVKEIFEADDPQWLLDYHDRVRAYGRTLTPEVPGVPRTVPGPVILVGEVQVLFGGRPGDNYNPFSRLFQTGDWVHERVLVVPDAGRWSFAVGVGGTGTDYHRAGGLHNGRDYELVISKPVTFARFRFDVSKRELTVVDQNGRSLLSDTKE
jgi:hypothetical protein